MNDFHHNSQAGPYLLTVGIFSKIIAFLTDNVTLDTLATGVSIVAGALAAVHYSLIIYEKLFKKHK